MALPKQLKAARCDNSTTASTLDNVIGELETSLADIFGFTLDTDITASPFSLDNSGRITKALIAQRAAGPVGWRMRDTTSGKEVRLVVNGTNFDIDENTGSEGSPSWTNRFRMAIATGAITGAAATSARMGLCPQGDGNTAHFLNGDLGWTTPSGAGTPPSCRVRHTSNQSINNNTLTAVTFTTEDFDTDTMHDNSTNPTRVTITTSGKYLLIGQGTWNGTTAGMMSLYLRKNGNTYIASVSQPFGGSSKDIAQECRTIASLTAGDYIELVALQTSGGALSLLSGADYSPVLNAVKVA